MFKNLKLSGKLWGLTFLLLVAVMIVAGSSIWSINNILSASKDFAGAADQNTFMVEKEADHLKWVKKVQDLFIGNQATLNVQLDHTKCGLGKFLYGEEGKALSQSDPKLAGLLEAIKEPHKNVHESGVQIKDVWQQNHPGLSQTLAARLNEHRRWAANVSNSLIENKEVNVQLDPGKCAFGKWLAGSECKKLVAEWPEFGAIIDNVIEHHNALHESVAEIKAAATKGEKNKIYLEKTQPELNSVVSLFEGIQELEAGRNEAQEKAKHIFNTVTIPALETTQVKMKSLADQLRDIKKSSNKEMSSIGSKAQWSASVVTVAAFIIGILVSFFVIRSVTRPIFRIIEGLNEGSDQVASASGQVSSSSQALAEGASEQAASIEETSSSLEEISSMTKQNAGNAGQADTLMKEANQVVIRANDSMAELTSSMEEISKASEETSKIIKTIDEIAFQTNLLALNAAVEAARAGEAGAGFAVVADEVRNLAMRAADAARNTANLIEGTVKKVKDGGDLVATTNDAFSKVAQSAVKVGELVAEIAAASKEQAQGIEQVNTAVVEMDKVVQQNAASAEESASASEEMNAQAEQMKGFVGELVTLVGGNNNGDREGRQPSMKALKALTRRTVAVLDKAAIARGTKVAIHKAKEASSEQIIPMDYEDFKDF